MNHLRRLTIIWLTLFACGMVSASPASPQVEPWREYLERYVGSWKGEMTIESSEGEILQRFPVAAEYWKDGSGIKGLTAFEIDGKMSFAESRNFLRNRLLFAEVTQGGQTVTYRGYEEEGGVVWIPYDAALNTERRMREWFARENGEEVLHVEGQEILRSEKGSARLILKARLTRQ